MTSAQVILRWHIEHGLIVTPKSMRRERMQENFDAFSVELSADEISAIDAIDRATPGASAPAQTSPDRVA